ncbi:MAG: peptidoglycan DD-metalloendopeptidase family protein [Actinobacteria bacterium]|nr:peptidoglycan DD-metalloendopeptidase family protein [Actinomycetota bacterium]
MPLRPLRSLVALALVAGLAATASASFSGASFAGEPNPDPKSQRALKDAIGEASAEETLAVAQLKEIQGRRAELEAVADALDAQISEATGRQQAAQREVDRIAADVAALQLEIDRLQAEIDASKGEFENSAATLYRNAGTGSQVMSVLAFQNNPRKGITASRYLGDVARDAQAQIDHYDALQDDVDAAQELLEEQQAAAEKARAVAEAQRVEVERLRAEHEPARAAAEAEEASEAQLLATISSQKDSWEAQLAALQAEQAALSQGVSRGSGNGRLKWACDGSVASGFGYRVHPISGTRRLHTGVDISCSYGQPISTGGDGTVLEAGPRGGYGNAVLVDHGDGLATLYAHQSRVAVSPGQQVTTGEVIGYVGSTGYSTGPHLHWEVWVNGTPVDPMGYV